MSTKLDYYNLGSSTQITYETPTLTGVYVSDSTFKPAIGGNLSAVNGSYVKILGNDFISGAQIAVKSSGIGGLTQLPTSTAYVSQQEIDVFLPSSTAGSKMLFIVNPNGFACATIINYS